MTIQFECLNCGKQLSTSDDKAGKVGKCPDCGEPVTVPQPPAPVAEENPFDFLEEPAANPTAPQKTFTRTCPMCGAENSAMATDCVQCGEELSPPEFGRRERSRNGDAHFSTGNKIDVGKVIGTAWERFTNQLGESIVGLLIAFLSMIGMVVVVFIGFVIAGGLAQISPVLSVLVVIGTVVALYLAGIWIGLGMMIYYIAIGRGQPSNLSLLFTGGRFLLRAIFCSLLTGLIVLVAELALGLIIGLLSKVAGPVGAAIGMVIAVIVILRVTMSFMWALYVLVDTDADGVSAVFMSRDLMAGNYLAVLAILIIAMLIYIAGAFFFGIGIIFSLPLAMVMLAVTYHYLSGGDALQKEYN